MHPRSIQALLAHQATPQTPQIHLDPFRSTQTPSNFHTFTLCHLGHLDTFSEQVHLDTPLGLTFYIIFLLLLHEFDNYIYSVYSFSFLLFICLLLFLLLYLSIYLSNRKLLKLFRLQMHIRPLIKLWNYIIRSLLFPFLLIIFYFITNLVIFMSYFSFNFLTLFYFVLHEETSCHLFGRKITRILEIRK